MLEKPSAAFVLGDWKKNGRNNGLTGKKETTGSLRRRKLFRFSENLMFTGSLRRSGILLSFLALIWLFSACSAAQTSVSPSSALRPVILTGTHWQATYLAFETAKETFPGDLCEKDDEEGAIKIHRNSFFHGNTLITIRFQRINDNNWFVNVSSEGTGLNQPLGNRSALETELYLKALEDAAAKTR